MPIDNETDIFLLGNKLVSIKEDVSVRLYYINKNGVLYRADKNSQLDSAVGQRFIDPLIEAILDGQDNNMNVRNIDDPAYMKGDLLRADIKDITKAREAMSWIDKYQAEIETFVSDEHDLKRQKAIVAQVEHPEIGEIFIIKALSPGNVIKGNSGWLMRAGKLMPFSDDGVVLVPTDNHVVIIKDTVFIFNESKLESLFNYNAKKLKMAESKADQISKRFKLSFLDGVDLRSIIKDNKPVLNKLQKVDPYSMDQATLLQSADELGIEMMTDDNGAIIIMDAKDLRKFVNLLNDDYMESPTTGVRYEIKGAKKVLESDTAE